MLKPFTVNSKQVSNHVKNNKNVNKIYLKHVLYEACIAVSPATLYLYILWFLQTQWHFSSTEELNSFQVRKSVFVLCLIFLERISIHGWFFCQKAPFHSSATCAYHDHHFRCFSRFWSSLQQAITVTSSVVDWTRTCFAVASKWPCATVTWISHSRLVSQLQMLSRIHFLYSVSI